MRTQQVAHSARHAPLVLMYQAMDLLLLLIVLIVLKVLINLFQERLPAYLAQQVPLMPFLVSPNVLLVTLVASLM